MFEPPANINWFTIIWIVLSTSFNAFTKLLVFAYPRWWTAAFEGSLPNYWTRITPRFICRPYISRERKKLVQTFGQNIHYYDVYKVTHFYGVTFSLWRHQEVDINNLYNMTHFFDDTDFYDVIHLYDIIKYASSLQIKCYSWFNLLQWREKSFN